jgi:molybdate/tungstate transport system ATP-binding protein
MFAEQGPPPGIQIERLTVQAGGFRLSEVSLSIPSGEYGILMGKTGCGKTTLLEAVCGLKRVLAGRILLEGRDVTALKPAERGIGFVPQDAALFSTMTVHEHLAFALRVRRWRLDAVERRVRELALLLDIESLLPRLPQGLSGGESQRVALGRALSFQPRILCLDEPLSALDHDTRGEICRLLARVRQELGVTVLHITHDPHEAARLAQHVFRMHDGAIMKAETMQAP